MFHMPRKKSHKPSQKTQKGAVHRGERGPIACIPPGEHGPAIGSTWYSFLFKEGLEWTLMK